MRRNKSIKANHPFEKFNKDDTWCKHCNCTKYGEEIEHNDKVIENQTEKELE